MTTLYIAVAGGMATVANPPIPDLIKLLVAVGVAVLSSFATWVLAHRQAFETAEADGDPLPRPTSTLRKGWYEILVAGVALLAWAAAMPSSWVAWGDGAVWGPALVVSATTVLIGGMAVLLNRTAE